RFAEAMRNPLKNVAKTVCKVISRIDFPLILCPVVRLWLLRYALGRDIPHLAIAAGDVLLHAQQGCLRSVFPVSHVAEFPHVGLGLLFRIQRYRGPSLPFSPPRWRFVSAAGQWHTYAFRSSISKEYKPNHRIASSTETKYSSSSAEGF